MALLQKKDPCLIVDIGPGQDCTINNIEMHLTGSSEEGGKEYDAHSNGKFESKANEQCMQEFFNDKPSDDLNCIILLKSGILTLNECTFTLNGIQTDTSKIPCIIVLGGIRDGTKLIMKNCKLKGDELQNENQTAGVVSVDADIDIQGTKFENFKSGAIMLQAKPNNIVNLDRNKIL